MARRTAGALLLAALLVTLAAAPGLTPRAVAASCSEWSSETQPPSSIRVFRTATGDVETVGFRRYLKNVLSREWIASWTTESLRSGALAVKNYAWYQVLHWRGYVNADGECFDIFDSTRDQVYDPSQPIWDTAADAVNATWSTLALQDGHIFATYYNAGSAGEPCGANANGWKMYQWGTQACGLDGKTAAEIMAAYYDDVVVTDAPPAASPTPSATPTASPSPSPTPGPSASPPPKATATPTGRPTPEPTQTPAPTPDATPPTELPGGGQSGVVHAPTPPSPPPASPKPVTVAAPHAPGHKTQARPVEVPVPRFTLEIPRGPELARVTQSLVPDARMVAFRILFPQALEQLRDGLQSAFEKGRPTMLLALLPRG